MRERKTEMIILPAIDIIEGKAVRLLRGDYDKRTVYSDDPVKLAIARGTAARRTSIRWSK